MVSVEYNCPSIDNDECVHFINMQLQNDDNVRIMFSILAQYRSSKTIKFHIILIRCIDVNTLSMIYPKIFEEIAAYTVQPNEKVTSFFIYDLACI